MQQPTPGPVVDRKYQQYIPEKYQGYMPTMGNDGIHYQKYMQGQPSAAEPSGASEVMLAAEEGSSHNKAKQEEASDGQEQAGKDSSKASDTSGFDYGPYMQQPTPGPVVDRKYQQYIPEKYQGYMPTMGNDGIHYQKYLRGTGTKGKSSIDSGLSAEVVLASSGWSSQMPSMLAAIALCGLVVLIAGTRLRLVSDRASLHEPLVSN